MIVLRELAPAKINLYLQVTGKRPDGYHIIDSLVAFADMGDKLEISTSDELTFQVTGPFAKAIGADENSVLRAAKALKAVAHIPQGAHLVLHKNLPVAAGIGGGSADAAAALRLLMRFWKMELPAGVLHAIALSIGADVPACLRSTSLYMGGIGDEIENGPILSKLHVLLVNPGKQLLTREVFAHYDNHYTQPHARPAVFTTPYDAVEYLRASQNDLQDAAATLCPDIKAVLTALGGDNECMLARMSGSGATCFGLFFSLPAAQALADQLSRQQPSWWVQAATIG